MAHLDQQSHITASRQLRRHVEQIIKQAKVNRKCPDELQSVLYIEDAKQFSCYSYFKDEIRSCFTHIVYQNGNAAVFLKGSFDQLNDAEEKFTCDCTALSDMFNLFYQKSSFIHCFDSYGICFIKPVTDDGDKTWSAQIRGLVGPTMDIDYLKNGLLDIDKGYLDEVKQENKELSMCLYDIGNDRVIGIYSPELELMYIKGIVSARQFIEMNYKSKIEGLSYY